MNIELALGSGERMPIVGLGLWKIPLHQVRAIVSKAIQFGYRHLDSASDYGNEVEVGTGIQDALQARCCRREDLWITSKLWNTDHDPKHVRPAAERSLRDLKLDYFDQYLIHFPIALEYIPPELRYPAGWLYDPAKPESGMRVSQVPLAETWGAMEDLQRAGLARHIGVANFNCALLRDLLAYSTIPPSMLQVELHPYLAQERLLRFCREAGVAITAFSPLGSSSYETIGMANPNESVLGDPVVRDLASSLNKSPAQIVLRWGLQRGTAVIPKTSTPQRLTENLALFDFELSEADMHAVSQLDRKRRYNDPGTFCETAFNTFFPIFD
jgi:D-xylose reductase